MTIPNALTDRSPAAAVFKESRSRAEKLFVAFKDKNSQKILLASSHRPEDDSSWKFTSIPAELNDDNNVPLAIQTNFAPKLAVSEGHLWIIFNNDEINNISSVSYHGRAGLKAYGSLLNERCAVHDASGSAILCSTYDGLEMVRHSLFRPTKRSKIPGSRQVRKAALDFWEGTPPFPGTHQRIAPVRVVLSDSMNQLFATRLQREGDFVWQDPLHITQPGAVDGRPALAMHGDFMYLAFKQKGKNKISLGVHNGRGWGVYETNTDFHSPLAPALVSFNRELYIIYAEGDGKIRVERITDLEPNPLLVMSVNVRLHPTNWRGSTDEHPYHWSDRRPRIIQMLKSFKHGEGPDIIGMQEVRDDQYSDLVHDLEPLGYESYRKIRGGRRGYGRDESMAIFWKRNRLVKLSSGSFSMNPKERRDRANCDWDSRSKNLENRVCAWVRLQDRTNGETLKVYDTHFNGNDCEGRGCALITAEQINQRTFSNDPVILMGDLNCGQHSDIHHPRRHGTYDDRFLELLRNACMEDTYRRIFPFSVHRMDDFGTTASEFKDIRRGDMIDFVLASPEINVLDAAVDRTLFTPEGDPVDCPQINNSGICEGSHYRADQLYVYSDHWAIWASVLLTPTSH